MAGLWDIKSPPPILPVRPGDPVRDRKAPPKRKSEDDAAEREPNHEQQQDSDDGPHIDEYA